jgi:hypothetical protein
LGSLLLVASTGILLWAFIVESYELQHFSDISRWGIFLSLGGVGLHLIGVSSQNRLRKRADET